MDFLVRLLLFSLCSPDKCGLRVRVAHGLTRRTSPVLYVFCFIFLFLKALCDGITFICIYGNDVQGNGKLFESALRKVHIGLFLSHLVLISQCYWTNNYRAMIVNIIVAAVTLFIQLLLKYFGQADFKTIISMFKFIKFEKPNLNDKADWLFAYTHPFVKKTSFVEQFISEFNMHQPVKPRELRKNDPEFKRKFELQLNKQSEVKKKMATPPLRQAFSMAVPHINHDLNKLLDPDEINLYRLAPPKLHLNIDEDENMDSEQATDPDEDHVHIIKKLAFESLRSPDMHTSLLNRFVNISIFSPTKPNK